MSDLNGARKVYLMLKRAGTRGVHSRDIHAQTFKGKTNPSERLREIADHLEVRKRREFVDGSPGIRAWLAEYAPEGTERVTPASHGAEGGDGIEGAPAQATVTALNPEPCAYPTHRVSDWRKPEGQWICGLCHPPALDESRIERREPLRSAA